MKKIKHSNHHKRNGRVYVTTTVNYPLELKARALLYGEKVDLNLKQIQNLAMQEYLDNRKAPHPTPEDIARLLNMKHSNGSSD